MRARAFGNIGGGSGGGGGGGGRRWGWEWVMVPRARVGRGDGPREFPRVDSGLGCPWSLGGGLEKESAP